MTDNPDPYTVLGVTPTATQAEITHAYRAMVRAHHPDSLTTSTTQQVLPVADDRLRHILAAYALLRDPDSRSNYDRTAQCTAARQHPAQKPAPPTTPSSAPVTISVTHLGEPTQATTDPHPPIWAGPVRQHHPLAGTENAATTISPAVPCRALWVSGS